MILFGPRAPIVLALLAAASVACEDAPVDTVDRTIAGMGLAVVEDPRASDPDRAVPCFRVGQEVQLAAHVPVRAGPGYSFSDPIELVDPWCRADDCVVRLVDEDWVVPRIAVTSKLPGRVEVEATIRAGGITERVSEGIDFRSGPCRAPGAP